ncbi:MAG: GC-type dockerin domain-anchored protein [Phycisphaerales bacterium]
MYPALRLAAALVCVPSVAHAQSIKRQPEVPDMPPAPAGSARTLRIPAVSEPWFQRAGFPRSVQVNVSEEHLDILSDAANEPSIAVDPTAPNRIVIGWRQFDTVASNFRQAGFSYSRDGGRSWSPVNRLTPGLFRSDPVLEADADGNFYYYSLPSTGDPPGGWRCEVFKSTNGGTSWSSPVPAGGGDRAWFTIDKSGGIGDGNIYGIWNPAFTCCPGANAARDSSHGLLPWPPAFATPIQTIWGTNAVGPDGELYIAGRLGSNFGIVRSDDARNSMASPSFPLSRNFSLGGPIVLGVVSNPGGAPGQTWVDVNRTAGPNRGHVYALALIDPPSGDTTQVVFIRSTDRGLTWSTPVVVNDDNSLSAVQWFPSMSVAPTGRIDVTFNDTRNTSDPNRSQLFYTFSLDEGATWSPNVPVGPPWNSTFGWPQQDKIGDYYDQESDLVGVSIAYAATYTGGQDVYFLRLGQYDCNSNALGDTDEINADASLDCNDNGILDTCEIAAGTRPDTNHNRRLDSCELCPADWNADLLLNSQDFFAFLADFFTSAADFNGSGSTTSQDFFDYLAAFFNGC